MARLYGHQYPNILSVARGRRVNWGSAAATSKGYDSEVNCVAFFPDGRMLASDLLTRLCACGILKLEKQNLHLLLDILGL